MDRVDVELGIGGYLPVYATEGSAAADLYAAEKVDIPPNGVVKVDTRIKVAIPKGYAGLVVSRSGLAFKNGIVVLNGVGVIDSDYRGNVGVLLWNTGDEEFSIHLGMRIAQMLIVSVESPRYTHVRTLSDTERGEKGFGSTGV